MPFFAILYAPQQLKVGFLSPFNDVKQVGNATNLQELGTRMPIGWMI